MQQRFHLQWFHKYEDALEAKKELQSKDDRQYQIRKKDGGNKFDLVVRITPKELSKVPENVVRKRRAR